MLWCVSLLIAAQVPTGPIWFDPVKARELVPSSFVELCTQRPYLSPLDGIAPLGSPITSARVPLRAIEESRSVMAKLLNPAWMPKGDPAWTGFSGRSEDDEYLQATWSKGDTTVLWSDSQEGFGAADVCILLTFATDRIDVAGQDQLTVSLTGLVTEFFRLPEDAPKCRIGAALRSEASTGQSSWAGLLSVLNAPNGDRRPTWYSSFSFVCNANQVVLRILAGGVEKYPERQSGLLRSIRPKSRFE